MMSNSSARRIKLFGDHLVNLRLRQQVPGLRIVTLVVGWWLAPQVSAHPEIELQLANISAQIKNSPDDAELYLQRGHLHRVHRDWQAGLADFRRAGELDPHLHRVSRAIGRLLIEADKPNQALPLLEEYVRQQPEDPEGLILRGRAQAKLGASLLAAADFDGALPKLQRPTPVLFIERAKILLDAGDQYRPRALSGLGEGIDRLGDLYTLHRFAAEIEIASGQTDAALQRVRQLTKKFEKNLSWRILEAELLASIGRADDALAAYRKALEIVTALPAHRRSTQAVSEIEQSIHRALAELGADE